MIGAWLAVQGSVALVAVGSRLALRWVPTSARTLQRVMLLAVPLSLLGAPAGPSARPFTPAAQVWAPADDAGTVVVHVRDAPSTSVPALPIGVGLVALGALPAAASLFGLRRLLRGAVRLRRVHGVEVWLAPNAPAPFATWLGRPLIVLDPDTAFDPALACLAVRHEACHHRHGDPVFAWALFLLAWASPVALLLREPFRQADELAVDHALVRRGLPALSYARALYLLSTRATAPGAMLAPGMAAFLPRRIAMLLNPAPASPRAARLLTASVLALAAPLGWAADGLVASPALTPAEVSAAVVQLHADGFSHADHPSVGVALDHLTRTTNGAEWSVRSLDRAGAVRPGVEARLAAAGLPVELSAVPFVESGYRNRLESELPAAVPPQSRGAGYWMFIASTARAYGLVVDGAVDERLDLDKETTAAIALLAADHQRYGDWGLALAAYNQGERAVDAAIQRGGTRDAFALADAGLLNDYVAQVYAAAILLQ